MPKSDLALSSAEYAPVADRITLFYERFPAGRIVTELVERSPSEVIFRAAVYRSAGDRAPAATGWAAEREGDGDVNTVACLENTETSAIGRALANLGFTASAKRPSAEEMEKSARARLRLARRDQIPAAPAAPLAGPAPDVNGLATETLDRRADDVSDVLATLRSAERCGLRARRAESLRRTLIAGRASAADLERIARALRRWLRRRVAELHASSGELHAASAAPAPRG